MTTAIFITVVCLAVAVMMFLHAKGIKGKGAIAAVFLAGMFLSVAAGDVTSDVRSGLVSAVDSGASMIASWF